MKNIVFLVTAPLTKRDYDRFDIINWINKGWTVKVFDFTKISKPDYWVHVKGDEITYNYEGLTIFSSKNYAYDAIKKIPIGTFFIDFLESNRIGYNVRKYVKKIGPIIRYNLGCYPIPNKSTIEKIKSVLTNPSLLFLFVNNKLFAPQKNFMIIML